MSMFGCSKVRTFQWTKHRHKSDRAHSKSIQLKNIFSSCFLFFFPFSSFFWRVDFSLGVFLFFFSFFFWIVCDVIAAFLLAEKSLWELTKFNQNCVQFRFRVEMNDFRDAFKTLMRRNVMAVTRMNTISQWATHGSSSLFYAVSSSWTINCQRRPRRQSSSFVKNFVAYLVAARYCI